MRAYPYILRCHHDSDYVGTTRGSLRTRVFQRNTGHFGGYTSSRWPVALEFQQDFGRIEDAIAAERQARGRRRARKEALIRGELSALHELSMRYPPFEKAAA